MRIFRDYIIIRKSTLWMLAGLAVAGCMLCKHYMCADNTWEEEIKDVADKGVKKAKEVINDVKEMKETKS